jgi:hypothetical protein
MPSSSTISAGRINAGFDGHRGPGATRWMSARPDTIEHIVLEFDQPQTISRLVYEVEEATRERTQEIRVEVSEDEGRTYRQILVQEYTVSPRGATYQREDQRFDLHGVTHLRLTIVPNKNGSGTETLRRYAFSLDCFAPIIGRLGLPASGSERKRSLSRPRWLDADALQREHADLGPRTARRGKTAHLAASRQHPVARNDQRHRISGHGLTDIACGFRPGTEFLGQSAIGRRAAPSDVPCRFIDALEEWVLLAEVELEPGEQCLTQTPTPPTYLRLSAPPD